MRRGAAAAAPGPDSRPDAANGTPMTENLDLDLLLAGHDPAPARPLTPAETVRQEELLRGILDHGPRGSGTPMRRPLRRRRLGICLAAGAALAGAMCAAVGLVEPNALRDVRALVTHGTVAQPMFTTTELASWTSDATPAAVGSPGARWCAQALRDAPGDGSPQTVTDADLRGRIVSEIVSRAGQVFLCMAGAQGQGFWDTIDAVPADLAARAVVVDTGGAHGVGSGDAGFAYATGFAGGDVRSVAVESAGHTTRALIQDHRWTAWWPIASFAAYSPQSDTVTITYTDGSSRTTPESALFRNQ